MPDDGASNSDGRARADVAFVIPYVGEWPAWSKLFCASVERNPCVDVIIVCEKPPPWPERPNVLIYPTSRAELVGRINSTLGLTLCAITGHKLCDFKPFFGLLFSDLLKGYGFWGFCDVDMMFGDLRRVLSPDNMAGFDVYSAHHSEVVGHFTVVRNAERLNRAAFDIANWRAAALAPMNAALDEIPFAVALASNPDIRWARPDRLAVELDHDFCRFGITFGFAGEVAHLASNRPAVAEWKGGRVFYSDAGHRSVEVLYVHFMGLKRWWHWLSFDGSADAHGAHRFSRLGYGAPEDVFALSRFPWSLLYRLQQGLQGLKQWGGRTLRALFPLRWFLFIRRSLLGSGRY